MWDILKSITIPECMVAPQSASSIRKCGSASGTIQAAHTRLFTLLGFPHNLFFTYFFVSIKYEVSELKNVVLTLKNDRLNNAVWCFLFRFAHLQGLLKMLVFAYLKYCGHPDIKIFH